MSESILSVVDRGVARITLNRPDALNSLTSEMARRMTAAIGAAEKDPCVRAVLLTGAGRAFSAGQDLEEVKPKEGAPPLDLGAFVESGFNPIIRVIRGIEKPVVCAVNGIAAGAGANLALACDIVLASKKAFFLQAFAAIGLIPDSGGTFFLPRLVGLPRATAAAFLGERVSAEQAVAWGMIYKACEPEALAEESEQLALQLATRATRGLGLTKRALNSSFANDLDKQLDLERDLQSEAGRTHDYQEGVRAFLEKREPKYRGE